MRRLLALLLRRLGEALVRLYYPVRAVEGAERIPARGPVVFVLNHPNGLLDPLVLRVASGRPARFLAKSSLFGNPFGRLAMDAFGSIPVYRAHEAGARARDASRNDESFARCRAALAAGEALALFPEGVSHSDPQLRPLKTGAARIALSAEAEHGGAAGAPGAACLGVTVVPVGLYYERKARFRSRVLLAVGEPFEVAPLLPAYRADERGTVEDLTARIRARLDEVVLQAESRDLLEGVAAVARWVGDDDPADLGARHRRARDMIAAYGRLRERDPARVERISEAARAYARTLRHLGVRNPWGLEIEVIRPGRVLAAVARLGLALPLAAIGAVMGWIPYRLAGEVAKRATADEDLLGTIKLLAGLLFLPVGWGAWAAAAGVRLGPAWAAPVFVAGVATGYVALRFEEMLRDTSEAVRHLWLRAFHHDTARRLAERRRALADAVAGALREAA